MCKYNYNPDYGFILSAEVFEITHINYKISSIYGSHFSILLDFELKAQCFDFLFLQII